MWAVCLPQFAQGQEVQSGPKACFGYCELVLAGPGLWQAASLQEHSPRFCQTVASREVNVTCFPRDGCAIVFPVDSGVGQQAGHCTAGSRAGGV